MFMSDWPHKIRRIIAPLFVRLSELDNVLNHEFAWIRINLTKSSTAHPVLCSVVRSGRRATTVLATASIDQLGSDIDGEAEGDYFGLQCRCRLMERFLRSVAHIMMGTA